MHEFRVVGNAATVGDVAAALASLGAKPRDLVSICVRCKRCRCVARRSGDVVSHVSHATHALHANPAGEATTRTPPRNNSKRSLPAACSPKLSPRVRQLDGGFAGDTFKQMFNEAIADKMSAGSGLGMSELFAQQLDKKGGSASAQPPIATAERSRPGSSNAATRVTTSAQDAPQFVFRCKARRRPGSAADRPDQRYDVRPPRVRPRREGRHTGLGRCRRYGRPRRPGWHLRQPRDDPSRRRIRDALRALERCLGQGRRPVDAGAPVGAVGTTGYSTGPHLHFEVRHDGTTVDSSPLTPSQQIETSDDSVTKRPDMRIDPKVVVPISAQEPRDAPAPRARGTEADVVKLSPAATSAASSTGEVDTAIPR